MSPPAAQPLEGPARLDASRHEIERWLALDRAAQGLGEGAAAQAEAHHPMPPRSAALLAGTFATAWLQRPSQGPWQVGRVLVDAALAPVARRHPWALTGAALVVGMAVGALRPWRRLSPPAVLAGLLMPALSPFLTQLASRCLTRPPGPDDSRRPPMP